jgi:hypothetical protein
MTTALNTIAITPQFLIDLFSQLIDVVLHFYEDGQVQGLNRVQYGRIMSGRRMGPGLDHQPVKHVSIMLFEGMSIVLPTADDLL